MIHIEQYAETLIKNKKYRYDFNIEINIGDKVYYSVELVARKKENTGIIKFNFMGYNLTEIMEDIKNILGC